MTTRHVLFLCTGNSARSILGEALLNHLGQGRFVGHSAGSHPKGAVHPLALQTLSALKIPVDGLRSKAWDEFAQPDAQVMDFVITVCDAAAGETCPLWPGQPVTAHWGQPDPAAVEGPADAQERAFREALVTMKRRIELLLALPLDKLDALALQRDARDIGTR